MKISKKIKYIRINIAHLSQEEFSRKLDVSRNTIKNWETEISKPTINHILLMSVICNVSIDYLIFENAPLSLSLYELDDKQYQILSSLINYYRAGRNIK